jgi:hypothetical protein
MIRRTTLVVGLATCAAALVPGSALAVTGQADKACYSHVPTKGSEPIVVTLTGGEPGASFLVTASVPGHGWGSAGSAPGTYDAAGNGTVQITDVYPPSGTIDPVRGGKIALSVRSYASAGTFDTPLGDVLVTNLAIDVASRPSNPSSRRKVRVSGTPFAHKRLYGFVVRGKKSKHVLRRFSLGRADVCGFAATKAVVAPKGYRTGTYWLYVNAGGKLNRAHSLAYSFRIYRSYF